MFLTSTKTVTVRKEEKKGTERIKCGRQRLRSVNACREV